MKRLYQVILDFLKRYERPLSTFLFIVGFLGDLLTFSLLDLSSVTLLFAVYIGIVIVTTIAAHAVYAKYEHPFWRLIGQLAPLAAQFTFGSLLSGFLIFFTKSATLAVSWPFIILLIILFFGNEIFRNYRNSLIFQVFLVYFSLYAFSLFAVPLYLGKLSTVTFFESTAAALVVFALYLLALGLSGWKRFKASLLPILISAVVISAIIVGSYLAGLLPPIPLIMKDGGIYHSITRINGTYAVQGEGEKLWWDPRPQVVHHVPGTELYAFSSIFAPANFSTSVIHEWQHKEGGNWVTRSTVAFSLSGGRSNGYRGYSIKDNPEEGDWRVLVKTLDNQTIGEFRFTVQNVSSEPKLTTKDL